jgi:hypothetical protein
VVRYGGEEFCVLLLATCSRGGRLAERHTRGNCGSLLTHPIKITVRGRHGVQVDHG